MKITETDLQILNREMTKTLFEQREAAMSHLTLDREYLFFNAIKNGDRKTVFALMEPLTNEHLGKLSDNPVRNIRYHLIITIALTTRFCIEAGLMPERAYALSDIYIRRADKCTKEEELTALHREVILEFTKAMQKITRETVMSLPILKIYDYIETHLHEKISLEELAEEAALSKSYLCDLFKRETGTTIGKYISARRISTAKDLLVYTEYTVLDISNYLAFSSMSHFISVFKAATGMTPKEYREQNYRKHFNLPDSHSLPASLKVQQHQSASL